MTLNSWVALLHEGNSAHCCCYTLSPSCRLRTPAALKRRKVLACFCHSTHDHKGPALVHLSVCGVGQFLRTNFLVEWSENRGHGRGSGPTPPGWNAGRYVLFRERQITGSSRGLNWSPFLFASGFTEERPSSRGNNINLDGRQLSIALEMRLPAPENGSEAPEMGIPIALCWFMKKPRRQTVVVPRMCSAVLLCFKKDKTPVLLQHQPPLPLLLVRLSFLGGGGAVRLPSCLNRACPCGLRMNVCYTYPITASLHTSLLRNI